MAGEFRRLKNEGELQNAKTPVKLTGVVSI